MVERKPDFETEVAKWWANDMITRWVSQERGLGRPLIDAKGWEVLTKADNQRSFVVTQWQGSRCCFLP